MKSLGSLSWVSLFGNFWGGLVLKAILFFVCSPSDDSHFKTNPKVPGIDLNSVRLLFETLSKPPFARLLEQVTTLVYHVLSQYLKAGPSLCSKTRVCIVKVASFHHLYWYENTVKSNMNDDHWVSGLWFFHIGAGERKKMRRKHFRH